MTPIKTASLIVALACVILTVILLQFLRSLGQTAGPVEVVALACAGPVLGAVLGSLYRLANPRADITHWIVMWSVAMLLFVLFATFGAMI